MNYKNVITISTELRKLIEIKAGISRTTIFTAIKGLQEKLKMQIYFLIKRVRNFLISIYL
jgi:hypothetical protein